MLRSFAGSFAAIAFLFCAEGTVAAVSEKAEAQRSYVIDYYGDSTTLVPVDQPGHTAPAVLQTELTKRCGFPVTVHSKGVTTTKVTDALNGIHGYPETFAQAMAHSDANMVIENYGINDALTKVSPDDYRAALREMAQIATSHGKVMVFETPNPVVDGQQSVIWMGEAAWLGSLDAAKIALAQSLQYPVVNQYDYFMNNFGKPLKNLLSRFPDGAHPNPATVRVKALRVADVVQPYVCSKAQRASK
jgi:lysophospholipase L1-like esterase